MIDIRDIAKKLEIREKDLIPYGRYKAKLSLSLLDGAVKKGRYILVSAMTPTKFGEGKTTTTIGLSMAFNHCGRKAVACIRQPSLGPYLGIKGGGTGGGKCRALPEEDINMHFTGDNYAISSAHNFIASLIDNHLFRGNRLGFDVSELNWPRAIDVSDAALREVIVGINWDRKSRYFPHRAQFCITAASELMSILALSKDEQDFKARLERIVLGFSDMHGPICLSDIGAENAVLRLLSDALMPNLVQSSSGTPVFIHSGPFANISIGASSVIADRIGLSLADYVFTEAGFGMDCGGEKFFDIKSFYSGYYPDLVVLVASLQAVSEYGQDNLRRHISIARRFGVPIVVLVNARVTDNEKDLLGLCSFARDAGADGAVVSYLYSRGPEGSEELVDVIDSLIEKADASPQGLYDTNMSIEEKLNILAQKVYFANGLSISPLAREKISLFENTGFGRLPICVAKVQYNFAHHVDIDVSKGYVFEINDAFLSAGAGFVVLLAGNITTLPGLPARPRALDF